ncbi:MAG: LysR substrate-binding domain-containing protein [Acidimicrobiia bacterium]|nr:LysR substrate-binding domain-containing protein [Acidimicrobiia bacterium]
MPLLLDLRHYETVTAIVDLGTMTAAADALHTTQSALSHRVAEAERRLGTKLFERSGRRALRPTQAGLAVHQAAGRALGELARCEEVVGSSDEEVEAVVRIAVGSYDCFHWFPDVLRIAGRELPAVQLQLVVVGDAPGPALADGNADLVIGLGAPRGSAQPISLFQDELMLMVAPGHRLARHDRVTADDLAEESYLTYNLNPSPGFEYDRFIRPAAAYPRLVTVVEKTSAITELVAAGAGVSILSRWALEPAVSLGRIAAVRCGDDGLDITWSAFCRAEEPPGSAARRTAVLLADLLGDR